MSFSQSFLVIPFLFSWAASQNISCAFASGVLQHFSLEPSHLICNLKSSPHNTDKKGGLITFGEGMRLEKDRQLRP